MTTRPPSTQGAACVLTGRGLGLGVLLDGLDYARAAFAPAGFRVTVGEWNGRSLRVCERAGFRRVDTFEAAEGDARFVVLWRQA